MSPRQYLSTFFILVVVLVLGCSVASAGLWDDALVRYEFNSLSDLSGPPYYDGVPVGGGVTLGGGVLTLDGASFVDIPLGMDNPFDGAGSFTVATAVKPTVAPILFSSATDKGDEGALSWYALEESVTEADIYHDVVMIGWLGTGAVPLLDGQWHHIVTTYDAGTGYHTIYFDGVETVGWAEPVNKIFTWSAPSPETYTNRIGGSLNADTLSMGSNFYEGQIGYFYIFDKVLSEEEIAQLMTGQEELQAEVSSEAPEDSAENVRTDTNLCFKPPEEALCMNPDADPNFKGPFIFDVYFGSGQGSLAWIPPMIGPVDSNDEICVDPCDGKLLAGTDYYWRVDIADLNEPGDPCFYEGTVLSFTTRSSCGGWGYVYGDMDGDCFVNFVDYSEWANAWATQAGDDEYDPNSDINAGGPDGFIDINDFVVLANKWLMQIGPAAPNELTFGNVTSVSIGFSWTDNSTEEDGFNIYINTSPNQPAEPNYTNNTDDTTLIATGLEKETTYYFWVTAYNCYGESPSIDGNETTTTLAAGPLITPGNFTLTYETDAYGIVPEISQSDYQDPGYNNFDYMGNESGDVFVEDGTYYWFYHGFGDQEYQIGLRWSDSPTGPWTRWGSGPIVEMTEPWENFYIACPMIVKDGATYYMFYTASMNEDDQVSLCLATASDLKGPWTKYSGNPVYIYDYETEGNHYNGGVLLVDGEWKLYSIQFDEIQPDHGHCYMATANAPEGPWTYRTEPVITAGPAGAWDAGGFSEFEVYYWNGEYHAFYGAGDDLSDKVTWEDESIGYAWSEDGINWTKYNDPSTGGAYSESDPLIDQEDVPNAQTMGQPFGFIDYPNIYLYYTLKYAECRPELDPCKIEGGDGGPWVEDLGILQVTVADGGSDPPTPNPSEWSQVPTATSSSSITMTATTASDPSGPVEYYFEETTGNPGGDDSIWQPGADYTDIDLTAETMYTYRVRTRDALLNTGSYSTSESETTPAEAGAVVQLSPLDGWDITDYAVSFRWERRYTYPGSSTYDYQVQCADNSSFTSPIIDEIVDAPLDVEGSGYLKWWTEMSYISPFDFTPGTYYWRVRLADTSGEPWSNTVQFTVNDDHTSQSIVRPLSQATPLFTFDMFMGYGQEMAEKWQDYYNFFPSDVKPYVALAIDREGIGEAPELYGTAFDGHFEDFMAYVGDVPVFVKTGGPDTDIQLFIDPTELEHAFQTYPNLLGIVNGENTWNFMCLACDPEYYPDLPPYISYAYKTMDICTKYGRWFIFGEHNYDEFLVERYLEDENPGPEDWEWFDPAYWEASNIILTQKSNTYWGNYHAASMTLGAWLTGEQKAHGLWHEAWYWSDIGWDEIFDTKWSKPFGGDMMTMPINFWFQLFTRGASNGASLFHFGGESSVTEWGVYDPVTDKFDGAYSTGFWDMHGNKADAVDKFLVPFIRAMVNHNMIPSKSEVLDEVQIAVVDGQLDISVCGVLSKGQAHDYGDYKSIYLNTYGIRDYVDCPENRNQDWYDAHETKSGARWETLPNNGRYYGIPILPYPYTDIGGSLVTEVDLYNLQTDTEVQTTFNSAYPERYTGDAWVTFAGDRIYMMNTRENEDIAETYDIPLGSGGISNISGTMLPHHYILCKRGASDNSVWFQSSMESNRTGDYTDSRNTVIVFTCAQQPAVTVTPSGSLVSEVWNGSANELTLTLSHNDGAVDVDVVVY